MRKQYHFRTSGDDVLIWDCHRLVELSAGLPREMIPLASIGESDEAYWGAEDGVSARGGPPCSAGARARRTRATR